MGFALIFLSIFCSSNGAFAGSNFSRSIPFSDPRHPRHEEWREKQYCDGYQNGSQCGCYQGYCWAYKFENSREGDPWCYTQKVDAPAGSEVFATCSSSMDCTWKMSCGSLNLYFGTDNSHPVVYNGEKDAASLRTKYQAVLDAEAKEKARQRSLFCDHYRGGNQCGCYQGFCWAYKFGKSGPGDPWCYTQQVGVPAGHSKWATCSTARDCSWEMTCGGDQVYFGSDKTRVILSTSGATKASLKAQYQTLLDAEATQLEKEQREKADAEARRHSSDPEIVADQAVLDAKAADEAYVSAAEAARVAQAALAADPLNATLIAKRDAAVQAASDAQITALQANSYTRLTRQIANHAADRNHYEKVIDEMRSSHVNQINAYRSTIKELFNRLGIPLPADF